MLGIWEGMSENVVVVVVVVKGKGKGRKMEKKVVKVFYKLRVRVVLGMRM